MGNNIYNNILYSIGKEVKGAIAEQFSISDIDFNDDDLGCERNIFNKNLKYLEIYDNILNK